MSLEAMLLGSVLVCGTVSLFCFVRARLELQRLDRLAHPLDWESRRYHSGKRKR